MIRVLYILCFYGLCFQLSAQLNCKTKTIENGSNVTSCYHKNGKISTIEEWDKDRHWGSIKGFSSEGIELFNYSLRSIAGHASIYLKYYSNGQVSKAEYSSMPDGGIQWYRYIHEFDESGKQTGYLDLSMPEGYPTLHTTITDTNFNKPFVDMPQVKKEIINTSGFLLINKTSKKVKVFLKKLSGSYLNTSDKTIELKPQQQLMVDSILIANKFLDKTEFYEPEIVVGKNKKNTLKLIESSPVTEKERKIYTWYIIKD